MLLERQLCIFMLNLLTCALLIKMKWQLVWNWSFNVSEFDLRSDLKIIKIKFDTPVFDRITKDRAAKFVDILSAIGGTMGLLTGFSIISAVEIAYFAVRMFIGNLFKFNKSWFKFYVNRPLITRGLVSNWVKKALLRIVMIYDVDFIESMHCWIVMRLYVIVWQLFIPLTLYHFSFYFTSLVAASICFQVFY